MTHEIVARALECAGTDAVKLTVMLITDLSAAQLLQLTGYYLPVIVGLLFFISVYSLVHDVSTLFLSVGIIINNILNTGLQALIAVPRPDPFTDYGQPARETQTLFFFVTFYAVYAHFWSASRSWTGPVTLLVAVTWSTTVYLLHEYYTALQVLGGAFVGIAVGLGYGNFVRNVITPHAHTYVESWNTMTGGWWWSFGALHASHAFHYHPGEQCNVEGCKGSYSYYIIPIETHTHGVDFGANELFHVILKIVLYALLYHHT